MAAGKDKMGRPMVVVTGLGVVTSLGAGKSDNWTKLAGGESGIRAITRFPTEGLKTRIAGTIDYLPMQDTAAALTESFANIAAEYCRRFQQEGVLRVRAPAEQWLYQAVEP